MSIAEQWATFETRVVPKDASPVQRNEMRMAFYAGASVILAMQIQLPEDEDAAIVIIESWHRECRTFVGEHALRSAPSKGSA